MRDFRRLVIAVFVACVGASAAAVAEDANRGKSLRELAGVRAGLAVHIGATDGRLETELASGSLLVHGLAADDAAAARARAAIRKAGLYGLASVETAPTFKMLPYADNLVNLLVVDADALGAAAPPVAEIRRVLAPHGVALTKRGGKWARHVEPVPANVDIWGHWDRDATGNPFSRDEQVGPTHRLRWLAGATSVDRAGSKVGLRISDGQVFYTGINYEIDYRLRREPRSDVLARDAFNGILRWKRQIDGVPGGGDQPPRFALTAHDGRVYCYPQDGGPLHALDAATGESLVEFTDGPAAPRIKDWNKHQDRVGKVHFIVRVFDGKVLQTYRNTVYLSDAKTGRLLWKKALGEEAVIGWGVAGPKQIFAAVADRPLIKNRASQLTPADRIVALDAATGEQNWQYTGLAGHGLFRLMYYRDSVIVPAFPTAGRKPNFGKDPVVVRLDAKDGRVVWKVQPKADARGHYSIVMGRGDEIIVGQQSGFGLDFATGKLIQKYNWGQADNSCADLRCLPHFTIYGLTFIDERGQKITRGQTRSICDVGMFPAYGLLYGSPLGCLCSEYINGYSALSSKPLAEPISDDRRLTRGPAFGKLDAGPLALEGKAAWPMHMADPRRSCYSPAAVPDGTDNDAAAGLKILWQRAVGERPAGLLGQDWADNEKIVGPVTAPTVAAGKVFVAAPDTHQLQAFDADTGKPAWSFTAGARIDSPPTILGGGENAVCLFGSRDGHVYCLRASDGELVWKFFCGRTHRRVCVQSQLESPWPVTGSVMVDEGGIVVTAGRQSAIDGGIYVYKLAPADGRILWKTRLWTDPDAPRKLEDDRDLFRSRTRNRRVNDLLVHNGERVCLWVTPLKNEYPEGELVDIEHKVISARALKFSLPTKDELQQVGEARWLWSASSAGLLSRRGDGVGRHDQRGVNYAELNATKICLAGNGEKGPARTLYALEATSGKPKALRGGLIRVTLGADGGLPDKPDWVARVPGHTAYDAMLVAGERIYVTRFRPINNESSLDVYSAADGQQLGTLSLPARVVRDGLAAAGGRLYAACADGQVICLGEE